MTSISANKYKTPLLFQILVTFFFLLFLVTAFFLITFEFRDAFYFSYLYGGSSLWESTNVYGIFYWNFGSFAQILAQIVAVLSTIAGILFIWVHRPKISIACAGGPLLIMILSLLRVYDADEYYAIGYSGNYTFLRCSIQWPYYLLWVFLAFLLISVVLAHTYTSVCAEPSSVTHTSMPQLSQTEELQKYKELLDSGILTEEEFQEKKKEILRL